MFDTLSERFSGVFRKLSGRGRLTEENIEEAMTDVRNALLEADVNYQVVKDFTQNVTQKALGEEVLSSLNPGEQMIKIVQDELTELMGPVDTHIMYVDPGPTVIMMAGLQGSGKTTTCAKLAGYLKKRGKSVMLAAADLQRPAAVDQLHTLTDQVNEEVSGEGAVHFYGEPEKVAEYGQAVGAAVKLCKNAHAAARKTGCDVLILDTAGRLHVNDELMGELRKVNQALTPHQIYLVVDAMIGQDAVNSARAFNEQLELDGVILTKTDSDTRGGAALSTKAVTGKPIKFIGTSEKLDGIEEFHPERMAGRILGMGDVVSLVEKAQEQVTEEEAERLQEKMSKGRMTLDDFLKQLRNVRRMGSMKSLFGMMPGIGQQLKNMDLDDSQLDQTEAIIRSMTPQEREDVDVIRHSRRRRIAGGSGTGTDQVSQLIKGFGMVSGMTKQMSGLSGMQQMQALSSMGQDDLARMGGGRGGGRLKTKQRSKRKKKGRKRKSR